MENPVKDCHKELSYINNNLLILRKKLNLTQGEFIEKYLTVDNKALISVPRLSNIEHGAPYKYLDRVLSRLQQTLKLPPDLFLLSSDKFIENINILLGDLLVRSEHAIKPVSLVDIHQNPTQELVKILSDYLTDNIMAGVLSIGARLPSDREMAKMFKVGRTALREAMKVLNVLGLIDIRPGQGTYIASNSSAFFMTPLEWTFLMNKNDIKNIFEVRVLLESETARLAAQNSTAADLKELGAILSAAKQSLLELNYKQFLDYDVQFHLQIARSCGNQIIEGLLLTIRALMKQMSNAGMASPDDLQKIYEEHIAIYHAIASRDRDLSSEKMLLHLQSANKRNIARKSVK